LKIRTEDKNGRYEIYIYDSKFIPRIGESVYHSKLGQYVPVVAVSYDYADGSRRSEDSVRVIIDTE
jgi:hypothetical protein